MTAALDAATGPAARGLLSRVATVIVSPHAAYVEVAARPRAFGALAVAVLVMVACQTVFLSTATGKQALLEQQVRSVEAFGVTVTDEMYGQMQSRLAMAPYTGAASQIVAVPLMAALVAGLLLGIYSGLLGGSASFRHVYAVVAHSSLVLALQQVFSTPISYARGDLASATRLSVFFPMLDEGSAAGMLLGSVDLFLVWWLVNLAIGVAVLYSKPAPPVVATLLGIYGAVAVTITIIRVVV